MLETYSTHTQETKSDINEIILEHYVCVHWQPHELNFHIRRNSGCEFSLFCVLSLLRNQSTDNLIGFLDSRNSILNSILDYYFDY